MSLNAGDKLGGYQILSLLGKGGMGEVYLARDTRLDREVAIKVLPTALARNPERLARFEREAKVLAALNHPNIAIIHGLEDAPNGSRAIVMELVEGPTLAERIKQGPIPIEEALRISLQIADALEAAHEKGVVHRDLKPANVKVREDGTVKVLDFGLATAVQAGAREPSDGVESPTLTMGATEAGVILGTASYMAPEQARGLKVDKRADIWAFGVVLYEMLTGKRLFRGEDASDTLAGVLRQEIDFSRAPAKAQRLLRRCLQRDPKQRLRDIGEARFLLLEESGTDVPAANTPAKGRSYWAAAAVLFLLAFAVLAAVHFGETPPQQTSVRFQVQPPEKTNFQTPQLSPDGHSLAFVAKNQIWIHSLDLLESHPLPGTEGGFLPFWAPDSANIGFFAQGKLKRIPVSGGSAQVLADAQTPIGGTWNRNDVILFTPNVPSAIFRVSATGGTSVPVTKNDDSFHLLPEFLPDGNHFLYVAVAGAERGGIYVGSLDGMAPVRLLPTVTNVVFSEGHLLFRPSETLMAQPFDPDGLRLTGDAFPIADRVGGNLARGNFTASTTGMVAYIAGGNLGAIQLAWADREGKSLGLFGPPGAYSHFRLAPDDKRIVYDSLGTANEDVWVLDSVRGVPSKLTFDPAVDNIPMWSPDGARIAWPARRGGGFDLYVKAANGTGPEELLVKMGSLTGWGTDWSKDGRNILYQKPGEKTGQDLWSATQSVDGKGDAKPVAYLQTEFDEEEGRFSPDGKWVTYTSNETGVTEVYVQSFPLSGAKFPISTGGGSEPQWSKDGAELFYLSPDRTLMAVPITRSAAEPFRPGLAKALFPVPQGVFTGRNTRSYAVGNDGKRFLVPTTDGAGNSPPLTVVLNWRAALKK